MPVETLKAFDLQQYKSGGIVAPALALNTEAETTCSSLNWITKKPMQLIARISNLINIFSKEW